MTHEEAIDVIAWHVLGQAVIRGAADSEWEDYPDIGEHDWEKIAAKVDHLAEIFPFDAQDRFDQAYELLADKTKL